MGLPWRWQSTESSPSSATRMHDFRCRIADPTLRASIRRQGVKAFAVPPLDQVPSFCRVIWKWVDRLSFRGGSGGGLGGLKAPGRKVVGHECHTLTGDGRAKLMRQKGRVGMSRLGGEGTGMSHICPARRSARNSCSFGDEAESTRGAENTGRFAWATLGVLRAAARSTSLRRGANRFASTAESNAFA